VQPTPAPGVQEESRAVYLPSRQLRSVTKRAGSRPAHDTAARASVRSGRVVTLAAAWDDEQLSLGGVAGTLLLAHERAIVAEI
jgi:hypothetical protein